MIYRFSNGLKKIPSLFQWRPEVNRHSKFNGYGTFYYFIPYSYCSIHCRGAGIKDNDELVFKTLSGSCCILIKLAFNNFFSRLIRLMRTQEIEIKQNSCARIQ